MITFLLTMAIVVGIAILFSRDTSTPDHRMSSIAIVSACSPT